MAKESLAKEHMSQAYVELDPASSVAQAITQLQQQGKVYGVIVDPDPDLPVLVTVDLLQRSPNPAESVGNLAQTLPRVVPVKPAASLNQAVSALATNLVTDANVAGLVVINDQQQVVGFVPRQTLARIAARLLERGGDTDRLEGASTVTGVYFYCPEDSEEKLVSYYNPANPPRCRNGHIMKRKPRTGG